MKLKEIMITKDLRKIINDKLFDFEIDKNSGVITCFFKSGIKSKDIPKIIDEYGREYTVINLVSLNDIKRTIKHCDFTAINYVLNGNNLSGKNIVIKGNTDIRLEGTWKNIDRLKVDSNNLFISNNTKIVPNISINFSSKNLIRIDNSLLSTKSVGTAYLCCDELNISDTDLLLQGDNLVTYSRIINLQGSSVSSYSFYTLSNDLIINDSKIDTQNLIDFKASEIQSYSSDIESKQINVLCEKASVDNNSVIIAREKINISDKNCDSINKVYSKQIIYNNHEIKQDEKTLLCETRKEFVKTLKKVESSSKQLKLTK